MLLFQLPLLPAGGWQETRHHAKRNISPSDQLNKAAGLCEPRKLYVFKTGKKRADGGFPVKDELAQNKEQEQRDLNVKKYLNILLLLILIIPCSGCMPYHFTNKPGISGNVIDSTTKDAISGADVKLTTWSFLDKKEKIETASTGENGSFNIPAEQRWSIYMVPLDPGPLKARVSIEKKGYREFTNEFYINTMGPSITNFKTLPLERLQ